MDLSTLGNNLRTIRKAQGFKVEEVAERAGISTVFLHQLENGTNAPSIDTFVKLCTALQAQPNCLLKNLVPLSASDDNDAFMQELLSYSPKYIEMIKGSVRLMSKYFD